MLALHPTLFCWLVTTPLGPWEPTPAPDVAAGEHQETEAAPVEVLGPAGPAAPVPAAERPSTDATALPRTPPLRSRWAPRWEASRLAEEPLAGRTRWRPGVGVEVSSANGRFSLAFNAFVQMQAMVTRRPGQAGTADSPGSEPHSDLTVQFRRARVWLGGNVFTRHIKYRIALTVAPAELGFKDGIPRRSPILDWYFTFDRFRDFTLVVGQYKVPYNHQRMTRITGLQFVDRSLANNEFTLDRDIGLDVRSTDLAGLGKLRYYLGVYLGDGIARYGTSDFGLMYIGRFEVLPLGIYDDLEESDLTRSMKPRLLLGGAYSFIDRDPHDNHGFFGAVPLDGGATSTHNATGDLSFKIAGFSADAAVFWRSGWRIPGDAVDLMGQPVTPVAARNGLGYFAQAGYLIPYTPIELGARWGQSIGLTGRFGTSLPDQNEAGAMLNLFFVRHFLKLQLDYHKLTSSALSAPVDQIRLQLQATF